MTGTQQTGHRVVTGVILRPTSICRFVFGDSVSRSPDGGSDGSRAATAFKPHRPQSRSTAVPATRTASPQDRLRSARRPQRRADGRGLVLTDDEVKEVLELFTDASTVVNATNRSLGGAGGAAPGASGGGGGAIGSGAIGGDGGPIGRIQLDGSDARAPGAGGGGAGSMDEAAVAGSAEELQIGSEGRGDVYGMDGIDGGATSFGDLVSAPGGAGGLSGSGVRLVSDRLRISTLLIGEYFQVREGFAFVGAAAWQSLTVLNMPQQGSLPVILILEAGGVAPGDYTVRVEVKDPFGAIGGCLAFPVTISETGNVLRIPFTFHVPVTWTAYGTWTVIASSGIGELARYDMVIKRVSA
jgi:hypothetical protein